MKPRERRETGQSDLFKARLDQIINLEHELVRLGRVLDWRFLETGFGAVYSDDGGQPPLPRPCQATPTTGTPSRP
jgi:transposase, IS5 family